MIWRGGLLVERFRHELNYEKLARLSLVGLDENGRGMDVDFDGLASLFNAQTIPYRVVGSVCFNAQSYYRSSCVGALWLECFNISMKTVRMLKCKQDTYNALYGLFVRL